MISSFPRSSMKICWNWFENVDVRMREYRALCTKHKPAPFIVKIDPISITRCSRGTFHNHFYPGPRVICSRSFYSQWRLDIAHYNRPNPREFNWGNWRFFFAARAKSEEIYGQSIAIACSQVAKARWNDSILLLFFWRSSTDSLSPRGKDYYHLSN